MNKFLQKQKKNYLTLILFLGFGFSVFSQALTGVKTVPGDYPNLWVACQIITSNGIGDGGLTINVAAGHTENVGPLIIQTNSTGLTRPLVIKKNGAGANPKINAASFGTKGGNNTSQDGVISIIGTDYVTIDGIDIEDPISNSTAAQQMEYGIGIFKQYSNTAANNGCQNITIQNCNIKLQRNINLGHNYSYACNSATLVRYNSIDRNSKGIYVSFQKPGDITAKLQATCDGTENRYQGDNGLLSDADVHNNININNNTIQNCGYGVWITDGQNFFSGNNYRGAKNIVVNNNTIFNFGTNLGNTSSASPDGAGVTLHTWGAGIFASGIRDFTAIGNKIYDGKHGASTTGVAGILVGYAPSSFWMVNPDFIKIQNNEIYNLNATGTARALGIDVSIRAGQPYESNSYTFNTTTGASTALNAKNAKKVEINNNNVHHLTTVNATFSGIRLVGYGGNDSCVIKNNIVRALRSTGNSTININSYTGSTSGLFQIYPSAIDNGTSHKDVLISDNQIDSIGIGTASQTNTSGYLYVLRNRSIGSSYEHTRASAVIKNNKIEKCYVTQPGSAVSRYVRMISIEKGGNNTIIENNIVRDNTIHCNRYNVDMIYAEAKPRSGTLTLNVRNNQILNNTRSKTSTSDSRNVLYGINAPKSGTNKNIYDNTIDSLEIANVSVPGGSSIRVMGIYSGSGTNVSIYNNHISRVFGDKCNVSTTSTSATYEYWERPVRGISVYAAKTAKIYNNHIHNISTKTSANTGRSAISGGSGSNGITVYLRSSTRKAYVFNNIIYDLFAPAVNSRNSIFGIHMYHYGKYYIYNNTIAIGGVNSGTPVTSSGGNFSVAGINYTRYSATNSSYNLYEFKNNLININVTNKGSNASSFCLKGHYETTATKIAKIVSKGTNNNVYYINEGARNFIYGEGYSTFPGGYSRCYAVSGVTLNASQKHKSLGSSFNTLCGDYKAYMGGRELQSYADLTSTGPIQNDPIPFAGIGAAPLHLQPAGAPSDSTFAESGAERYEIGGAPSEKDYSSVARAAKCDVGALEFNGVRPFDPNGIKIDLEELSNTLCNVNRQVKATISTINAGRFIPTGTNGPRIYYRKTTNTNALAATNTSASNGWKFVKHLSKNVDTFTFEIDYSILNGANTPTFTIEYFIVAEDSGAVGDKSVVWMPVTFTGGCPNSVILTSGVFPIEAGSANSYEVLAPASVTSSIIYSGTRLRYTAATSFTVCLDDSATFNARNYNSAQEQVLAEQIRWQIADNNTFTTNLVEVTGGTSDTIFGFKPITTTTKYLRSQMLCGGSVLKTGPIMTINVSNCAVSTVTLAPTTPVCEGASLVMTATGTATPGTQSMVFVDPDSIIYRIDAASPYNATLTGLPYTKSGTWQIYSSVNGAAVSDQGFKSVESESEDENNEPGVGLLFSVSKPVTIASIRNKGGLAASSGYKISLFKGDADPNEGDMPIKSTGALSNAAGAIETETLNWDLLPGMYKMILEETTAGAGITGGLIVEDGEFPYEAGDGITILSGIENYTDESDVYYHFMDWDVTTRCLSPVSTKEVVILPLTRIVEGGDLIDTMRVCNTDSISLAVSAIGVGMTYQWQKHNGTTFANISGATDSVYKIKTNTTNSGKYRVSVTGSCGSSVNSDTCNLLVLNRPSIPSVKDDTLCFTGDTISLKANNVNNVSWFLTDSSSNAIGEGNWFKTNINSTSKFYAKNNISYTSEFGCYSYAAPFTIKLDSVSTDLPPTTPGLYYSSHVCRDNSGWSHFWDKTSNKLLLSLKLDPTTLGTGMVNSGWNNLSATYQVGIGVESDKRKIENQPGNYLVNDDSIYMMRRYWFVNTNNAPYTTTGNNLPVKFYFYKADYENLKTSPVSVDISPENMMAYKLPHNYSPGSSNHGNAPSCDSLQHGSIPSLSAWNLDTLVSPNVWYAHSHVTSFSGGGMAASVFTPLPIKLQEFKVSKFNKEIKSLIEFAVTEESSSLKYEIEWSIDGRTFVKVGELMSRNTTQLSRYSYLHQTPIYGLNYYRIKVVKVNSQGNEYTEIRAVDFQQNNNGLIKVFPIPTSKEVTVMSETEELGTITITDNLGKMVYSNKEPKQVQTINVSNLAQGVYFITIMVNGVEERFKLLIH